MARKHNGNNPLQIRLRVESLPRSVSLKRFNQRLIQYIMEGRELPASWVVKLGWRNPKTKFGRTKRWQYDDFQDAISDSREGFVAIVHDALIRRLRRIL